ncbi:spore germination protein [Cohnella sp. REN36]|uniref:spore germination protein n=1 Tax=Cohnella sp. REN36 TaxID=2887347 RepID=UPI001D142601|nr:spore germination protein [Cohnella sp. REN36]MCC3373128.1 spore germination protein [Cohnella sp. REN36]
MVRTGLEWFDSAIAHCGDVRLERIAIGERSAVIAYTERMIDGTLYTQKLLPEVRAGLADERGFVPPLASVPLAADDERQRKLVFAQLFSGSVILFAGGRLYDYSISNLPERMPEESSTELSVKGPRDGLIEELYVNLTLIRKRLRTPDLKVEQYRLGSESQTRVALLYMASAAPGNLVEEARRRLSKVTAEVVYGSGQWEELIADRSNSLFPLIGYTGRPDFIVRSLIAGRVAFLVDGLPIGYTAPANLYNLLKSAEDNHNSYYYVTVERILRLLGLVTTLALPGFWVALSAFSIDQFPFPLLSTIVMSRTGLPMSTTMEMFFMLGMFELFREAGLRLPQAVGQTVAVVGGIIVGDAAIRAGLTSPTMLVVSAITNITSFTLVNQTLLGSVSLMRIGVVIASSFLGMFGFFVSMFAILLYLASLSSFGVPYLAPLAPIRWKSFWYAFVRFPTKYLHNPLGPRPKSPERR